MDLWRPVLCALLGCLNTPGLCVTWFIRQVLSVHSEIPIESLRSLFYLKTISYYFCSMLSLFSFALVFLPVHVETSTWFCNAAAYVRSLSRVSRNNLRENLTARAVDLVYRHCSKYVKQRRTNDAVKPLTFTIQSHQKIGLLEFFY